MCQVRTVLSFLLDFERGQLLVRDHQFDQKVIKTYICLPFLGDQHLKQNDLKLSLTAPL